MELPKEVLYNIVQDFKKKEIDKITRAKILRLYMQENNLSLRSAAKTLQMPKTSVHDMLAYENITPEKLDELKSLGYTTTQIDKAVRADKINLLSEKQRITSKEIDLFLEYTINRLKDFFRQREFSNSTSLLLHELKDLIVKCEKEMRP